MLSFPRIIEWDKRDLPMPDCLKFGRQINYRVCQQGMLSCPLVVSGLFFQTYAMRLEN